ncbi:MAG: hypothetical protein A2W28_09650 [Gammaproteobacteria bacterium RBG_16_51_14]|nr:MAG: hypothetical protein A2W28_09650 [Gammaproteobacteria bacterium RBG_16_51_14]
MMNTNRPWHTDPVYHAIDNIFPVAGTDHGIIRVIFNCCYTGTEGIADTSVIIVFPVRNRSGKLIGIHRIPQLQTGSVPNENPDYRR